MEQISEEMIRQIADRLREELKDTYQSVTEQGDELPDVKEIGDKVFFVKDDTLYLAINGEWKQVAVLT